MRQTTRHPISHVWQWMRTSQASSREEGVREVVWRSVGGSGTPAAVTHSHCWDHALS